MGLYRQYTGADGQAHIEIMALDQTPDLKKGLAANKISFHESPVGHFHDWHPAPRRQFIMVLAGQMEIGIGDGSKHVYGPGDTWLVEDTTGQGHTARVLGNQPCRMATIVLA